jgi:hypothetical protein
MDVHEPVIEQLIKGTFLYQSGLEDLFDKSDKYNPKFGFMLLELDQCKELFNTTIKYNLTLIDKIINATGIDISKEWDLDSFTHELEVNISFMVAITYCFYTLNYKELPKNDLKSIGSCYREFFINSNDVDIDTEFADLYESVFLSD